MRQAFFFFGNIFVITFYVYKAALPARRDLDSSKQELGKFFLHERMHDDDLSQPVIFREGPSENLWGGGRAKYKKKIRAREN